MPYLPITYVRGKKWTFSRLEELVPFIELFYPLLVILLWDCACAAGLGTQVGLCVLRALSQPPAGFGFPAVLWASPSCPSQAVPSGRLLFPPLGEQGSLRASINHTGSLCLVPSLSPVPRQHCNAFCRISPSALPFPAALHAQLPGTENGN